MRRVQILILMVVAAVAVNAATFTGKVVDEKGQPFPFANVVILNSVDSAYIAGSVTDDAGAFSISCTQSSVIVKVSCVGYETQHLHASAGDLGTIQLQSTATILGEVLVKGVRPAYKLTGEGLKTDVEGTLLSKVGTATDVLENLPGVQRKGDDHIEVFGKGEPVVYVNGRLLRDKNELGRIKSDDIQSVELITNPGVKYKADVESVILIKTKRPQGEGFSFDTRATAAISNHPDYTLGLNWNYRHKGLDVFGSMRHYDGRSINQETVTLDVEADKSWRITELLDSRFRYSTLDASLGLNYIFNDRHAAGFRYDTKALLLDRSTCEATADVMADGAISDHIVNNIYQKETSNMPHTLNVYYNGKIGNTSVDFNTDYVFFKNRTAFANDESSHEQQGRTVTATSMTRNELIASKLVLSWPLLGGNLQVGGEYDHTRRNDEYANPEQVVPSSLTEQRERNYILFAEYAHPLPFGQLHLGLRNENVTTDYYDAGVRIDEQSRNYHHFFPIMGLNAVAGEVQLMLNYDMKIQRPNYSMLSGNTIYLNHFTWTRGNPRLQPSIANSLSLTAMWKWMALMLDYKHTRDAIVHAGESVEGSVETTIVTHSNVDHANLLQAMLSLTPTFGIYQPRLTLAMQKDWVKIPSPVGFISPEKPAFMVQMNNNLRLHPTIIAQANLSFTSCGDNENITLNKPQWQLYLSLTKTFLGDALSVKVAGHNLLNTQQDYTMRYGLRTIRDAQYVDSRKLEVTVRYKFNAAKSKYRGTGAGQEEKNRL